MAGCRGAIGRLARAGAVTVCVAAMAACSGGDDQPSAATAVATPTDPPTSSTPSTSGAPTVSSTTPTSVSTTEPSTATGTATDDDTGTGTDTSGDTGDGSGAATTTTTTAGGGDGGGGDGGGDDGGGGGEAGAEWELVDSLPAEAYPAFTDANWSGVPSPALAADAASLSIGVYHASRAAGDDAADASIALDVRRFEACTVAPGDCVTFEGEEIPPEEIAPSGDTLTLDLALDATLRVGVSGVDCQAEAQVATGAELAAMMRQFDADYAAAIAEVPQSAIDANDVGTIVAALLESPSGRFEAPACFEGAFPFGSLRWRGESGPGVLLQTPLADDGDGGFVVPASASSVWIRPSALEVGDGGTRTLYLDAGFTA